LNGFFIHPVVNCIGESFRARTVITEKLLVYTSIEQESIDVGEQRIQKICALSFLVLFVKVLAGLNINHRVTQNIDLHGVLLRSIFLAASQETK